MSVTTVTTPLGALAFTGFKSSSTVKVLWSSKMNEISPTVTPAFAISSTQKVSFTSSSAQSANAVAANVALLMSTQDVHISVGANPTATTSDFFLPKGIFIAIAIDPSFLVAAIRDSADGALYISGVN